MNILEFFHSLQTQAKNVGAPFRVPSCMRGSPVESHTSRTKRSARSGWCTSRGDELVRRRHQNTPERTPSRSVSCAGGAPDWSRIRYRPIGARLHRSVRAIISSGVADNIPSCSVRTYFTLKYDSMRSGLRWIEKKLAGHRHPFSWKP